MSEQVVVGEQVPRLYQLLPAFATPKRPVQRYIDIWRYCTTIALTSSSICAHQNIVGRGVLVWYEGKK